MKGETKSFTFIAILYTPLHYTIDGTYVKILFKFLIDKFNFSDTCCGMAYLESKHVVHRDLAARNVLLSEEGQVNLLSFFSYTSFLVILLNNLDVYGHLQLSD